MRHPDQVRLRDVAVTQHDAFNCTSVQGAALSLVRAVQWQVDVHPLFKGQQPLAERPPSDSFKGHNAMGTDHSDVDDPCGVFREPHHGWVNQRYLALDYFFEIQLVGAENAGDLLYSSFDLHVGRVIVGIRVLLHDMLQLLDLVMRLNQGVLE